MLEFANQVRRKKAWENKMEIYEMIDKNTKNNNSGLTIYDLTKKLNWSNGKVEYYIKKLVKEGYIKNSDCVVNGRVRKEYSSKTVKELIKWDEMKSKPADYNF
ncbi:MAG: winged helix-turn-helix transcriptional regulator [Promethearchaeota archaeon]|nr:MAG: winged helix-turn-helix transcriptional regulator [Candidatus Lokiarchaeota archaeon]